MYSMLRTDVPWWLSGYESKISNYKKDKIYKIKNEEERVIVEVELPGYKKDEVSISLENRFLSILAENEERGRVDLRFKLNDSNLSSDQSNANLKNGILRIEIEKEKLVKNKIEIMD